MSVLVWADPPQLSLDHLAYLSITYLSSASLSTIALTISVYIIIIVLATGPEGMMYVYRWRSSLGNYGVIPEASEKYQCLNYYLENGR